MKNWLRFFAVLEGISFLALLGIGMPMKYIYGVRWPNQVIGQTHGILFLTFLGFAYAVAAEEKWPARKQWIAFAAAVLPLGTFWFDRKHLR